MKPIAVVVLSWNAEALLKRYLPILVQNSSPQLAEIILADNGSDDGSVAYAESLGVTVLQLERNWGFAQGYNKAINELSHKYVLLLNNDVRVTPKWLEPLYDFMEAHNSVVAVQPKIRWDREVNRYEYAGAEGGYLDYLGYPFCRGRIFETLEMDNFLYGTMPKEVFWTSGAAMLVRREAYVSIGGFDDRFFAHQEEIDLCWRWKSMGYHLYVVPESIVYHYGGGSLSADNPQKTYLNFRNNRLMLYKNLPKGRRRRTLFIRFLLDLVAAIVFLLKGNVGDFKAVLKALRDSRKLQKAEPNNGRITDEDRCLSYQSLYPHSLLFRYHIKGEKTFNQLKR